VFDLFTQIDRHLERAQGGLGIGLTLVKSLVEMHGGTVQARSEGPGRGSEFILRLPLAPSTAHDGYEHDLPDEMAAAVRAPASTLKVVVCDDNVDAADSLSALLCSLGHEAHSTYEGSAALRMARELQPQVMVLDLGMPGLDGYAVAKAVRSDAALSSVRLVALSGYGQPEDRKRTAEAGFDAHLVKPVEVEVLVAALIVA
jgi:CheY-like chemotaxis protein